MILRIVLQKIQIQWNVRLRPTRKKKKKIAIERSAFVDPISSVLTHVKYAGDTFFSVRFCFIVSNLSCHFENCLLFLYTFRHKNVKTFSSNHRGTCW